MDPRQAFEDALGFRERVASRYLILAKDPRYLPPRHILNGVDSGELDPKVLLIWKYVVEKMGDKFGYAGGTVYWRNKCAKEGIALSAAYMQAGEGAAFGAFKIKSSDQIEDWVKERLRSAGLVNDTHKSAEEWTMEITHLQTMVKDAQDRIEKHQKGLEEGSRVNQRTKWLAEAKSDLEKATKDLEAAQKGVVGLQQVIEKHVDVQAPVIDFEKQFQAALHIAANDLSKREVLAKAKAALAKFEAEMSAPKLASERQAASILDIVEAGIPASVQKLWNWLKSAFEFIGEWAKDLVSSTKQIEKLLESV
jgi:hypothetical protein